MNQELKYENKSYSNSVKQNGATVNYYTKQLDDSNETIRRMNNIIRNLEDQITNLHNEVENESRKNKENERIRFNNDTNYQKIQSDLEEKDKEIKEYLSQLEQLTEEKNKLYDDNSRMFNDIDHLQSHIYLLSDQNKKLVEKIEMLRDVENKINSHFIRKKEMLDRIRDNKNDTNKLLEKELIPQTENPDDFNTFGNLEEENKKESNELVPENNL
jgi:chromosome segregation ATPase